MKNLFFSKLRYNFTDYSEYKIFYKILTTRVVTIIGIPICIFFSISNLYKSRYVGFCFVFTMLSILCFLLYELIRTHTKKQISTYQIIYSRAFLILFIFYLIYTVGIEGNLSRTPWFLVFPLLMFFSNSKKETIFWILSIGAILTYFLYYSNLNEALEEIYRLKARLLYVFGVLAIAFLMISSIIQSAIQNMFVTQRKMQNTNLKLNDEIREREQAEAALLVSEKKYKTLFNTSPIGLVLCKTNGDLVEINPAYSKIIGQSVEEVLKLSYTDITPPTYQDQEEEKLESLERKNHYGPYEKEYIHKQGHLVPVRLIGQRIELNGEKLIWSSVEDITEQKKLERQVINSQKMDSIGNLAGGIAHDFNNLLFPILGRSEILIEDLPKNSPEYKNAKEIFRAGKRAADLVKQILAFSRQSEHKMTPIRIEDIVKEALKLSRSTIPANIEIYEKIQQNCGLITANSSQMHQVAMNLITNAFHAIGEKNGLIDIKVKEITLKANELPDSLLHPGRYIRVSVTDNGIGMTQSTIDKIFDPYFTTKKKGKGTGLGLAVAYGIVKEHKGEIKVHSEVGKGTTFKVYLPLMKETSGICTVANRSTSAATGTERILVVDDDVSVARLEGQILSRLGYQITVKTNSKDALNTFKANPNFYDMVISDMTMPGMTGDQLSKEILSIKPYIPIIICTGFSERINKEHAKRIGVKAVLMKPVVKFEMALMVRNILDESKKETI